MIKKRFAVNLLNVMSYLEDNWGKKTADDFYSRVINVLGVISSQPYIGAPSEKITGLRGLSITKHNRLFYKIEENKVVVVNLSDTRKKNY